ncbi:MAG: membrane protein insertase YidC [Mycobacteriales bacterium]
MNLNFLYTAISWLLLRWHDLWGFVFGVESNKSWVLSIIFLVITIRLVLFPLFVKQIKSQRKMQELQPKMKALQAKHKGDKETLQREMMSLYKENGANPVAGCLPIFLQAPVFLSLYHVLKRLDPTKARDKTLYGWTGSEFDSAARAKIFGAPISAHLSSPAKTLEQLNASGTSVKIVGVVLIAIMVITTYITQRQMIAKQQAAGTAMDPQQLMIQRLMLYGIPASLLISGSLFPLGVVLYWCTTNVWSMGQQFYVLRKMPIVGAPAAGAKEPGAEATVAPPKPGARPQRPKKTAALTADSVAAAAEDDAAGDAATAAPGQAAGKQSTARKSQAGSAANGSSAGSSASSPNGAAAKGAARPSTNKPKNRKGGRR